ncbi:MAG: CbtA family protein [Pseudomonadota bacterium]
MFRRILMAAIVAGVAAGLVSTGLQVARLWPLILEAEKYEDVAQVPHAGPAQVAAPAVRQAGPWEPEDGPERMGFTLLFNLLVGFGFGLILNAVLALRRAAGEPAADARQGALWGLAGFACFVLAPALGLPADLPGKQAAELLDRQLWWAGTAAAAAAGLGALVFAPRLVFKVLGVVLLLAPHAVGAPRPEELGGAVPPGLAAEFAVNSLAVAGAFWLVLGSASGWLQRRPG